MRIIWLDDLCQEASYQPLRAAMESAGLEVTSVIDEASLHAELKGGLPDLVVLDFQLPGTSGVEVAQRILALDVNMPILFLSEFTSQYPVKHQIDPRARFAVVFKPVEEFQGWAEVTLAPTIFELMQSPRVVATELLAPEGEVPGIWDRTLEDLDELDLDQFLELAEGTSAALADTSAGVFAESSAEWLVFILVDGILRIVNWGSLENPPPTSDALRKLERGHGSAGLVVSRPVQVEMVGGDGEWSSCSFARDREHREVDRFPSLDMELNAVAMTTHVDTGSLHSWLSYEDARELNVVPEQRDRRAWRTCSLSTVGNPVGSVVSWTDFELRAEARARDGFTNIAYAPRVVRKWRSCALAKRCVGGGCRDSDRSGTPAWCGSRRGLVGRDILRRNRFLLVFDSVRKVTYVVADDDFGEPRETDEWEWTPPELTHHDASTVQIDGRARDLVQALDQSEG